MSQLIPPLMRPFVIIESPYATQAASTQAEHLVYLRRCLRDSYDAGEHPFASHALYPFFLSDSDRQERHDGISFGYSFWPYASAIVFYLDYGMSPGMDAAHKRATHQDLVIFQRTIGAN